MNSLLSWAKSRKAMNYMAGVLSASLMMMGAGLGAGSWALFKSAAIISGVSFCIFAGLFCCCQDD